MDQLTSKVLSQGGTPLQSKSFAYDAMGNRTATSSVTSSDTVSSTYTANRLNQITAHNSSWSGGANTLASALQYDQSGNLTKWESTGTGSATSTHTEYIYDDLDRLTAVVKKNPTSSANESKTEFRYDGFSRLRVTKEYTWNGTAWVQTANSEKHRIYDGMDVVQERDENNAVLATYTRAGNIGGILSKRDDNGDDYFFHYDGSGNVIGLTDETEASVAEYAYDAYGNLLSSSGTQANKNNYCYSTKEHFGNIGLYNYGYRFYSPGLGRWINRDPIEERGGINQYGFVLNDPVNKFDLRGLQTVFPWGADTNAAIGDGVQQFVKKPVVYPPLGPPEVPAVTIVGVTYLFPYYNTLTVGERRSIYYHESVHRTQCLVLPWNRVRGREIPAYRAEIQWLYRHMRELEVRLKTTKDIEMRKLIGQRWSEYRGRLDEIEWLFKDPEGRM